MIEVWKGISAVLGGVALGLFFFIGLWWTVRRGVVSAQPAVLFLGSMLVRTLVVVSGFYWIGRGDWRMLVCCLAGFILARVVVTRKANFPAPKQALALVREVR